MEEMVNVHAAKTNFSKLLARVASGEEIVIARGGVPVAKLVPYASDSQQRPLGMFAGQMWLSEDALETPEWLLDAFEGVGGELPPPPPAVAALPVPKRARVAEPSVQHKPRKK
jgi:prevent-host-death family protein